MEQDSIGSNAARAAPTAAEQQNDEMKRRLLLDVIVRERALVPEQLSRKDQALLVGRDAARLISGRTPMSNVVLTLYYREFSSLHCRWCPMAPDQE